MNKRKFVFLVLLVAVVLCWTVGPVVAQENPVVSKREKAWSAYQKWVPDRMKGDTTFQKYMAIYNEREKRLSEGTLLPKPKPQVTRPHGANPKGGPK